MASCDRLTSAAHLATFDARANRKSDRAERRAHDILEFAKDVLCEWGLGTWLLGRDKAKGNSSQEAEYRRLHSPMG